MFTELAIELALNETEIQIIWQVVNLSLIWIWYVGLCFLCWLLKYKTSEKFCFLRRCYSVHSRRNSNCAMKTRTPRQGHFFHNGGKVYITDRKFRIPHTAELHCFLWRWIQLISLKLSLVLLTMFFSWYWKYHFLTEVLPDVLKKYTKLIKRHLKLITSIVNT